MARPSCLIHLRRFGKEQGQGVRSLVYADNKVWVQIPEYIWRFPARIVQDGIEREGMDE